jgi:hypothetical protein
MRKLQLVRRNDPAWLEVRWRSLPCRVVEECQRCAELEMRIVALLAELAVRGTGEHVIVICPDGKSTPGGRVQALVDSLFDSVRNHPVVWTFIGVVVAGVFGTIFYNTVILWMRG